jgi:hypothetical protein
MRGHGLLKRLACGVLFLAVLGVAGGPHHHEILGGGFGQGRSDSASRVVSNHSPLSRASHWHSGKRVQSDPCLACLIHRIPAVAPRAQGIAPTEIRLFVNYGEPAGAALVFRLCDPTRGPPSLS